MTFSDDLNFGEQTGDESTPPYPVVFGVTFTPMIIGIIVGCLGLLGAIYMLMNLFLPAWDTYQQQVTKSNNLKGEIQTKEIQTKKLEKVQDNLAQVQNQQTQVLSLFASEKSLDTLLLDTNRLVELRNTPNTRIRAKLQKFVPVTAEPEIINDDSFGPLVNNKLKRSSINVEIWGSFEQTQSIMRQIELLQPLLIIKNYESKLDAQQFNQQRNSSVNQSNVLTGPPLIITTFQLQALLPLTNEESERLAKAAAAAAAKNPKSKK
ncbi:MAG TPA: pilus assembly protein PilO [Nostocaceae cyanobacterium]|nr:pilus assembly protein PilO [Nostocaceae cyanobacterium]